MVAVRGAAGAAGAAARMGGRWSRVLHGILAPGPRQLSGLFARADEVEPRAVPADGLALVALLLALATSQTPAALSRVAALFGCLARCNVLHRRHGSGCCFWRDAQRRHVGRVRRAASMAANVGAIQ